MAKLQHKTGYYVWVGSSKHWFRTKKAANRFYMTRLSQYGSGVVSMTDWDGNTEHVYDDDYKNPARKVKGKSTTLKNMASVTVTKLPNGVVKITGRKMATKRNGPFSRLSLSRVKQEYSYQRKGGSSRGSALKRAVRSSMSNGRKGRRNPRSLNGYVVYPSSVAFMSLARANKEAKAESRDGKARVDSADTGKVVSRWSYGRKER